MITSLCSEVFYVLNLTPAFSFEKVVLFAAAA